MNLMVSTSKQLKPGWVILRLETDTQAALELNKIPREELENLLDSYLSNLANYINFTLKQNA